MVRHRERERGNEWKRFFLKSKNLPMSTIYLSSTVVVVFLFCYSVLLSLQSNMQKDWYLSVRLILSFAFFSLPIQQDFYRNIHFLFSLFDKALCKLFSLTFFEWMLFEKGRWCLSCMCGVCAYTCLLPLSPSSSSSSFKYFELRIPMMKRSVIHRWRLWSNFECEKRTRIFHKSSLSVYFLMKKVSCTDNGLLSSDSSKRKSSL